MLYRKVSTSTIPVDTDLSTHLLHMMEEESENIAQKFPEGSFKRIFWIGNFKLLAYLICVR